MNRRWILGLILGVAAVGVALVLSLPGFTADSRRRITLVFIGSTNIANGGRLGDGTHEFPLVEFSRLGLAHPSGRWQLELFRLTNGTRFDALIANGSIEVWSSNRWVPSASTNRVAALYTPPPVMPGGSTIIPVATPETGQPWRVRFGVQESARGLKANIDRFTVKWLHRIFFPGRHLEVVGPSMGGAGNGVGIPSAGMPEPR